MTDGCPLDPALTRPTAQDAGWSALWATAAVVALVAAALAMLPARLEGPASG